MPAMDAVIGISFEALQGVDLRTTKEKQAERLAKNRDQIYDNVKDVVREGFQRAPFSDDYNDKIQKIAYRYSDYLEEMAPREAKAKKLDDQVLLHWAPLFIVHLVEASAKDAPDGSGVQYMRASTLAHYRKGFAAYLYYSAHKKGPIYKEIQLRMLQAEANARRRYGLVLGTKPKAVWGEKEAFEMIDMILDEHVDVETTLQRCAIVSLLLISGARPGALFATDYYPENFIRWEDVSFEVDEYGFKGTIKLKHLKGWQASGQKSNAKSSTSATRQLETDVRGKTTSAIPPINLAVRSTPPDCVSLDVTTHLVMLAFVRNKLQGMEKKTWDDVLAHRGPLIIKGGKDPIFVQMASRSRTKTKANVESANVESANVESANVESANVESPRPMTDEKACLLLQRLANQLNLVDLGTSAGAYCFRRNALTRYYETFGLDAAKKLAGHLADSDVLMDVYNMTLDNHDVISAVIPNSKDPRPISRTAESPSLAGAQRRAEPVMAEASRDPACVALSHARKILQKFAPLAVDEKEWVKAFKTVPCLEPFTLYPTHEALGRVTAALKRRLYDVCNQIKLKDQKEKDERKKGVRTLDLLKKPSDKDTVTQEDMLITVSNDLDPFEAPEQDGEEVAEADGARTFEAISAFGKSLFTLAAGTQGRMRHCELCRADPTVPEKEKEKVWRVNRLNEHLATGAHTKEAQLLRWIGCVYLPNQSGNSGVAVKISTRTDATVKHLPKWNQKCPFCDLLDIADAEALLEHLACEDHRDKIPEEYHVALSGVDKQNAASRKRVRNQPAAKTAKQFDWDYWGQVLDGLLLGLPLSKKRKVNQ